MKHLEKIIFLVVLIVVAGLSAWVFMGGAEDVSKATIPNVDRPFELSEYKGLPPIPRVEWPEPVAQDDEGKWLFRVFTPPKLYIIDGKFVVELPAPPKPPTPEPQPIPFGVALIEIVRNQYRLQLDGIYETQLDDIDSALLSFENVYASQTERPTISLKKGETNESFGIRVEDVKREDEYAADGSLSREHIATITDLRTGKTVVLSDLTTLYEEGVTLVFASTQDPNITAELKSVGETFEMNGATYTLSEVNLDRNSVQLVKESEELDVPEVETLKPQSLDDIRPTETAPANESSSTTEDDFSDFGALFE